MTATCWWWQEKKGGQASAFRSRCKKVVQVEKAEKRFFQCILITNICNGITYMDLQLRARRSIGRLTQRKLLFRVCTGTSQNGPRE